MRILNMKKTKEIFNKHCWMKKESYDMLEGIIWGMLEDMACLAARVAREKKKRKALPEDIVKAYQLHKEKYIVSDVKDIIDRMTTAVQNKRKEIEKELKAYYGKTETALPEIHE